MVITVPRQDYRVSGISIRCVDCGQDVGLYPARHKCGQSATTPTFWNKIMNIYSHSDANAKTKPSIQPQPESPSNTNFWGRIKTNMFSSNAPPDSDDSDWEEETHVERILREYYQTKEEQAPDWIANPPPSLPSQTLPTTSYTIIETSKFEEHEAEGNTQGELQIDTSRLIYQTRLESNSSRPSPSRPTPTSYDTADSQKYQVLGSASTVYPDDVPTQRVTETTEPKKIIGNTGRSIPRNHTSPSSKTTPTNTTIPRVRTSPTKSTKTTVAKQRSIYTQRMDSQTLEKSKYKS